MKKPKHAYGEKYYKQVSFLLDLIPIVAQEQCFALKGGTAINLFLLEMPRLSVDIDLTYLDLKERNTALGDIAAALERIAKQVSSFNSKVKIERILHDEKPKIARRLNLYVEDAMVKIEPNSVIRGAIFEPREMPVSDRVQEVFEKRPSIHLLEPDDIWAGKFCAALDRQHPRDLFDVKNYFEKNEKISQKAKDAFLVYLLSHPRPLHEVLFQAQKDISTEFKTKFQGMTEAPVQIEDLYKARQMLVSKIHSLLTDTDKAFLVSISKGNPKWENLKIPQAPEMPAIKWKLHNISKMDSKKREQQAEDLERQLNKIS